MQVDTTTASTATKSLDQAFFPQQISYCNQQGDLPWH
jgi:hypothetical protein